MNYNSREELEYIGKSGVTCSTGNFIDDTPYKKIRILSSYWLCTKMTGSDIVENLERDGFWESWITLWISNNVKPGSICIDAGANYGYFTFFLASHGCKVFSVEANPELMKYLIESVNLNGCKDRVKLFNKAITKKSYDVIELNIIEDAIGSATIMNNKGDRSVQVETMDIRDLMILEPKIDFIKMDIEGAEETAWAGVRAILQNNVQCKIVMEFSPSSYKNRGKDLFQQMTDEFQVQFIDTDGTSKPIEGYGFFEQNHEDFYMLAISHKNTV